MLKMLYDYNISLLQKGLNVLNKIIWRKYENVFIQDLIYYIV